MSCQRNQCGRGRAIFLLVFVVVAGLTGCGRMMTGTYHATIEPVQSVTTPAPGYSLEDVRAKLAAEPEEIELRANQRFQFRRAGEVVWDGVWRVDGEALYLRAETVRGVAVLPKLQDDKRYRLESGAIVDEGRYGAYGLRVVYRRK